MGFYEKIKWVLGILMVFILILTTNLIDRTNFIRVKESVASIYQDRLIAYDLLFDMAEAIHSKETAIRTADSSFYLNKNSTLNESIDALITRFEQTKLTVAERNIFKALKQHFADLQQAEKSFIQSDFSEKEKSFQAINHLKESLHDLSEIQLSEGKRQVSISQNAIDTVELFTHIEIYILILLAIAVQIVVMYKPKD